MKKLIALALVLVNLLILLLTLVSCDEELSGEQTIIDEVTLTTENCGEYLNFDYNVNGNGGSLFPYSSIPGINYMYINPSLSFSAETRDVSLLFEDVTVAITVYYVDVRWQPVSGEIIEYLNESDILTTNLSLTLDEEGSSSSRIVNHFNTHIQQLYVTGVVSYQIETITGKVIITCEHSLGEMEIDCPASCTTYGEGSYHCENCEYKKKATIEPLGHEYVIRLDENGVEYNFCERCGATESIAEDESNS